MTQRIFVFTTEKVNNLNNNVQLAVNGVPVTLGKQTLGNHILM
jgi:hypothetical protein